MAGGSSGARARMEPPAASAGAEEEPDYMADLSLFLPADSGERKLSILLPITALSLPLSPSQQPSSARPVAEARRMPFKPKEKEHELREAGMSTSIPSSNIGFKLLQQMGYQAGQAIGTHLKAGQGRVEPLGLDLKRGRTGLGVDELQRELKRKREEEASRQQLKAQVELEDVRKGFQTRSRGRWEGRKLRADISRARASLGSFGDDAEPAAEAVPRALREAEAREEEKLEPLAIFRRREGGLADVESSPPKAATGEEEDEELFTPEILYELLERLRSQYFFCLYCGIQYPSFQQMNDECPGLSDEDH
eukprot:SM000005S17341  [mRNA]  locus=s5:1526289:1528495:- [translate_table: standard]